MISALDLNKPVPTMYKQPGVPDPTSGSWVPRQRPVFNAQPHYQPPRGGFNIGPTSPVNHTNYGLPFSHGDFRMPRRF